MTSIGKSSITICLISNLLYGFCWSQCFDLKTFLYKSANRLLQHAFITFV